MRMGRMGHRETQSIASSELRRCGLPSLNGAHLHLFSALHKRHKYHVEFIELLVYDYLMS
jgi:hypothetical protein